MANKVRPITPGEIAKTKRVSIPDEVFEAFNELIVEHFSGNSATIRQADVVALIEKKGLDCKDIFKKGWLNVEGVYGKAGWSVTYDKPGYNEIYPATFTFTRK